MPAQPTGTLAAAAQDAPATPGVYVLLNSAAELLYVGKAVDLRRRLRDHARKSANPLKRRLQSSVHEVRWIECSSEREALCREADLIVALTPPLNAVMAEDGFIFVCIEKELSQEKQARLTFQLENTLTRAGPWTFGAFPHLGKGKISWRAKRTNAGYSALLRLLWIAFGDEAVRYRVPARLRGSSPPSKHKAQIAAEHLSSLRDFMSGRSGRLLPVLADAAISPGLPAYLLRPLDEDLALASEFYELGPRGLRHIRLRHGIPSGPIDRATFRRSMKVDLEEAIGPFAMPRMESRPRRRLK